MPAPDDYAYGSAGGDPFAQSAGAPVSQQSQLDFDIAFYDAILDRDPDYVDVLRCQGELLSRKGLHHRALFVDRRLAELLPDDCVVQYNLACSLAMAGSEEEALAALTAAFEAGYSDFEHLACDSDLDVLRPMPGFQALLKRFAADNS
jgi:hypothetical protein